MGTDTRQIFILRVEYMVVTTRADSRIKRVKHML